MKKMIAGFSLLVVMLFPKQANSQKVSFSAGAELAFPAGNYQEVGNSGIGGFIQMEDPWSKHVSGILSVEYIQYSNKEFFQNYNEQFSALPIQFGVKYYTTARATHPAGLYLSGQLGLTGEFYHVVIHFENNNGTYDNHEHYVGFCNTMGLGYKLGIVDAGFRFQTVFSGNSGITSYYNFRLAFTIR